MSYWEDYYIKMYNTYFPNGYNMKWNTSQEIRDTMKVTPITIQKPIKQELLTQDNRTIKQLIEDERILFEHKFEENRKEYYDEVGDDRICYQLKHHTPRLFKEFQNMSKLYFDYHGLCDHTIPEALEYLGFSETTLKLASKQLVEAGWLGDSCCFSGMPSDMQNVVRKVLEKDDSSLFLELFPTDGYPTRFFWESSYSCFRCNFTPKGRIKQDGSDYDFQRLTNLYNIYNKYNILYGGKVESSNTRIYIELYICPQSDENGLLKGEELRAAINNAFETYWYKHQGIV